MKLAIIIFFLTLCFTQLNLISLSFADSFIGNIYQEKTQSQKILQRARVTRSIASDENEKNSHTRVVGYLIVLSLPLFIGFWLVRKKAIKDYN